MGDRGRDNGMQRVVPQQFLRGGEFEGRFFGLLMAECLLLLLLRGEFAVTFHNRKSKRFSGIERRTLCGLDEAFP